ncbi:uncharacterized protein DUF732 [Knoellia remsis]|uniref:Uncharacterized protein DUF732 n=1 Tax=Knoellia remsis TaxID=407159 RepID=A0A2T0UNH3_9MICO|nr:DUF732 domain-containing protein [Knoellia remsis]PRY59479.1 uncharacterized protein DUF732 [Knoellia remsis]
MITLRKTTTLFASAALALTLTACGGSDSNTESSGDTTTNASSPTGDTSPSTDSSEPAGGDVAESAWLATFKKGIPELEGKSDDEIIAAAKKVCDDFRASPDAATAKKIVSGLESDLGIDSMKANLFIGGATGRYCEDMSTKFLDAQMGG